jgi:hypothetical protein
MEVKARTEFVPKDSFGGNFQIAASQRIKFLEEIHKIPCMHHRTIRTEIAVTTRLVHPSGNEHLRELITCHADPGVRLRIFEKNVVLWLILFDKIVLQKEGIRLGIDHRILRVGDFRNESTGLGIEPLLRNEVLGNPLMEILSLPHINNLSLGVIVSIDSGGMGE